MNIEELKARIAELEAENDMLRGQKKTKRLCFPRESRKKFKQQPWYYDQAEIWAIGKAIRGICFPHIKKPHKHHFAKGEPAEDMLYDYVATVDELTEEQYKLYCELIEKVIDIIAPYQREKEYE